MTRALIPLALLLVAASPAAASAAEAPPGAVKLSPNVAGRASALNVELGADVLNPPAPSDRVKALSLFGTRGLKIDRRAVRARCSDAQADSFECPEASRVGTGRAEGRAEGVIIPGGGFDFTATIDVFLTAPRQQGDVAGVVVSVQEPQSNQRFNAKGRIRRLANSTFGSETRFEDLDAGGGELPPGVTVKLNRVELRVGANRTVKRRVTVRRNGKKRRVTKRIRYTFLRNPRRCTGSWPYRLNVEYATRTDTYDGGIACRKR